jgi:hypothetical protein
MTRLLPGVISSSGAVSAYSINQSLRFNFADSSYLSRTPASSGNRTTWTWSAWIKLSNIQGDLDGVTPLFSQHYAAGTSSRDYIQLYENKIWIDFNNGSSGVFRSTRLLRDPSAWYHLVFAVDTAQATNTNRVKFYVNGEEVVWSTATYPSQNYQTAINLSGTQTRIGGQTDGTYYTSGYLTDINFVDGQQLTPASFGESNSITNAWQPKRYTGSYGTNGFFLNFSDKSNTTAATLGKDYSGNTNNFTPNGFSVASGSNNDVLLDSPTDSTTVDTGLGGQVVGNYCTLNPADTNSPTTLTNGGLQFADAGSAAWNIFKGTMGVTSGKWYWEVTPTNINAVFCVSIAAAEAAVDLLPGQSQTYGVTLYNSGGVYREGNSSPVETVTGYNNNDVVGVALDMDNGKVWFRVNGTFVNSGNPVAGTNAQSTTIKNYSSIWMPAVGTYFANSTGIINFGQRPFAYTAPTGFKALCTANLPTPSIIKPETAFETVLYTGTGGSQTISGLSFSPDLLWLKMRSTSGDHYIFDTVRGNNLGIYPARTYTQENASLAPYYTQSFTNTGFTITQDAGGNEVNFSSNTYVAWAWDAASSTSTNNDGTVTSYVRANQPAGFSIVQYNTGSNANTYTVGHGLGSVPRFIMIKGAYTTDTYNWDIYHAEYSPTQRLKINSSDALETQGGPWDDQRPSSTVIYQDNLSNFWYGQNKNNIAYCFTDVPGYSRFGKWTNNNSSNGTFVNLGFRPKMILLKNTDNVEQWYILDSKRHTINVVPPDGKNIQASTTNAEGQNNATTATIDFLSNGFKIRTTNPASGEISFGTRNYVYAAFAESPFKYARAR